ncbi:FKBP-type peptidyl-prolyl cis-trans isomerase [Flavobacterium sp. XGLA_31]|uniref:FKBP-type peptidyl-prolyl cis-trans isomerase n=1 Tax=Flavobacterium sp. XGLA_31 TaxID=3447666 RepID=UPI003F36209D
MNNFFKSIVVSSLCLLVVSCSKSDSSTEPLRDYSAQNITDMANIEAFMKSHHMEVSSNFDVTFTEIPSGGTEVSIWDQTTYERKVRTVTVKQADVDVEYKIYYFEFQQGSGTKSKSPCNVDNVYSAYHGEYIYTSTKTVGDQSITTYNSKMFEEKINPVYLNLSTTIRGWSEIFPKFKTGDYVSNPDGTISYSNFGAGLMFIPSGLAYYGSAIAGIPSYSPLIFNVKLYEVQRNDQDGDGIPSYQEDLDGDGYVYKLETGVTNPDNTDGIAVLKPDGINFWPTDEIPDYLDSDDDNDGVYTKNEIKYTGADNVVRTYPFDGAAVDDPLTIYVNEMQGIPSCSNDYTSPTRLRKHRDPNCQ